MTPVTHIRSDDAQRIHDELVAALGTENNPAQWMLFMRTVREHLPDVLRRGRPTRAAIEKSAIGALGFASWREMCETGTDQRGLGLPWSQWRQWSRAWRVVQSHPGLEGEPLTAAQVNRLHSESQSADEPMPTTMEKIEAFQARQAERKQAAREETQAAQKARIEAIEEDLAASREEAARTAGAVNELREQIAAAQSQLADESQARQAAEQKQQQALQAQQASEQEQQQTLQSLRALQQAHEELQQKLNEYRHRSFFRRFLALFSH
ncbi:MAG: hypothetical protein L0J67_11435 [Halomonas sp.]|nr:hypothetical protein [Halomonas sp.]MDN6337224.1 hypothetical protein [Halomonas sp.]